MIEQVLGFSLSLWLGTYLISRDARSRKLLLAGLSLISGAVTIALNLLLTYVASWDLLFLASVMWIASIVLWGAALSYFIRGGQHMTLPQRIVLIAALPLFVLLQVFFSAPLMISLALSVPAMTAAYLDASERGEALLPDVLRSFDYAAFMCLVFGGQVALMLSISGDSLPLILLLLGTISASIFIQVFSEQSQVLLDRIAFFRWARLRMARADLRAVANALPRAIETPNLDQLSDEEFNRHTRRALSHFGDLPRLASNPLIYLPAIDARLAERHATDNTLERAIELKALLTESIMRMKPRGKGDFGTTNEWRHYNALYYPYVMGLKPYSVRATGEQVNDGVQEVLRWFNDSVPERTLYNWQTAATKLVANDLRERQQESELV